MAGGRGDYLRSHDIEDLVAVLDGRPSVVREVQQAELGLQKELSQRFNKLLQKDRFVDAISAHMPSDESSQARVRVVLDRMGEIAENNS